MDKFTYFWCLINLSLTIFFIGAYKNIFIKIYYIRWVNKPTRDAIAAENGDRVGIATVINEALLQLRIKSRSSFLWSRHALIFFGFMILFAFDCFYTVFGHYFHHFFHVDYFVSGPGKAIIKVGMEISGTVLLVGLTIGLVHRVVFAAQEKKYVNLGLIVLLWVVVVTGFLTEAFRFVIEPNDPFIGYSFLGGGLAAALSGIKANWNELHGFMWVFHATVTVAFFAYVPFSKFVHILVAPLGRSVTQGGDYNQSKRARIAGGLL